MARAKRTDRAAARRRHRAQLAAEEAESLEREEADAGGDEAEAGSGATRPSRTARPTGRAEPGRTAPAPGQGGGIGYAFRASFRQAHVREDLAHIGENLRQRSLWLTCLISVAVAVVYVVYRGQEVASGLLFQYFVYPPPIGAIFIAGFFARRASYLAGAIAGLVSGVAFCVVVAAAAGTFGTSLIPGPSPSPSPSAVASVAASASPGASVEPSASVAPSAAASPAPSAAASPAPSGSGTGLPNPADLDVASAISYALTVSPISGIIFGSAAAWYRRFLNLASPGRTQRRPPPKGRSGRGR